MAATVAAAGASWLMVSVAAYLYVTLLNETYRARCAEAGVAPRWSMSHRERRVCAVLWLVLLPLVVAVWAELLESDPRAARS